MHGQDGGESEGDEERFDTRDYCLILCISVVKVLVSTQRVAINLKDKVQSLCTL